MCVFMCMFMCVCVCVCVCVRGYQFVYVSAFVPVCGFGSVSGDVRRCICVMCMSCMSVWCLYMLVLLVLVAGCGATSELLRVSLLQVLLSQTTTCLSFSIAHEWPGPASLRSHESSATLTTYSVWGLAPDGAYGQRGKQHMDTLDKTRSSCGSTDSRENMRRVCIRPPFICCSIKRKFPISVRYHYESNSMLLLLFCY